MLGKVYFSSPISVLINSLVFVLFQWKLYCTIIPTCFVTITRLRHITWQSFMNEIIRLLFHMIHLRSNIKVNYVLCSMFFLCLLFQVDNLIFFAFDFQNKKRVMHVTIC